MTKSAQILILSSHTNPGLTAPVNHQIYAERHGYDYLFDVTPYPLKSPYDQKLHAIIKNLRRAAGCEWLLWVDDDVYFMDHAQKLEQFLPADPRVDFVICRSPVNPEGRWTMINSGVFFVRNSESAIRLLEDALRTDNDFVRAWWNEKEHGIFIPGGDQERMLYLFATRGLVGTSVIIHEHTAFNSRVYHFNERADEQFVCHLASHREKSVPLMQMRSRFGLDRFLLPASSAAQRLSAFRYSVFASEPKVPKWKLYTRIRSKAARVVRGFLGRAVA